MINIQLPAVQFTDHHYKFRHEVREFLQAELNKGTFSTHCDSWLGGFDTNFSKIIGKQGWIGMTWPQKYGGSERSALDRYIVIEELLATGAPVAAHWFADRQTGPLLLKFGTEAQKAYYLPKIADGSTYFCIGLSESNSGSDLASISTKAEKTDGGWILNGMKIWTSGAHIAQYMIVLCRTSPKDPDDKYQGMSQFILDLNSPGVSVRPIKFLTGEEHFNEVFFENVFIPEDKLVGQAGNGWKQSMAELAYERSGPERILSTFPLLNELIRLLKEEADTRGLKEAMKLVARLKSLRMMSIGIAQLLEEGKDVSIVASLVKDMGTQFEKSIAEMARLIRPGNPSVTAYAVYDKLMAEAILHAPGFTIRGGTTEILRGIVTKGMVYA